MASRACCVRPTCPEPGRSGTPAHRRRHPGPLRLVAVGALWFGLYNVALNAGELRVDAVGLVVAFSGVVLIATSTSQATARDWVGVGLCLVSAAAYAVSLVIQKLVVARLPAVQVTWTARAVGTVTCLPFTGDLLSQVQSASAADLGWVVLSEAPPAMAYVGGALCLLGVAITRRRPPAGA